MNEEIKDLYWEHSQHSKVQEGCSECHKENRLILAKKTVSNRMPRNPYGDNYPLGVDPDYL